MRPLKMIVKLYLEDLTAYDCTKEEDIRVIFKSLHAVKQYIDRLFEEYTER